MTTHRIHLPPSEYLPLMKGEKTFQVTEDQNYLKGDKIVFEEWEQGRGYTGRRATRHVSYKLSRLNHPEGIAPGFCVVGFNLY